MSLLPVIELCTEYFRNKVVHYLFILIEMIRPFLRMFFGKPQIQVRKNQPMPEVPDAITNLELSRIIMQGAFVILLPVRLNLRLCCLFISLCLVLMLKSKYKTLFLQNTYLTTDPSPNFKVLTIKILWWR